MKTFILLLFAFLNINAKSDIELSNLELSNFQVISMERVENKLYMITYSKNSLAKLDVYDLENKTITQGFLDKEGLKVTLGNGNMFKDIQNNLYIGDVNNLYIIDKYNNLTNLYEGHQIEDSSHFEIKSFTEDNEGNIYFLKSNYKMIVSNEDGPGSFGVSNVEVWKIDINRKLHFIKLIENAGSVKNDIYYYDNKIFFSVFADDFHLYSINLNSDLLEKYDMRKINIPMLENIGNSEIKTINIEKILLFQDNLYYFTRIVTKGNYNLGCLLRHDYNDNNFKVFAIVNDDVNEPFPWILSLNVNNDKILLASLDIYGKTRRRFSTFDGSKFEDINYDATIIKPKLLTSEFMKKIISDFPSQYNYDDSGNNFFFHNGIILLPNGTLYGATDQGLIVLENFLQPSSSVKTNDFITYTIPELTSVQKELYIESEFVISSYNVFDINSKILQTESNLNSNNVNLNLESLTIGIYFIELETQKGSKVLRFIKN